MNIVHFHSVMNVNEICFLYIKLLISVWTANVHDDIMVLMSIPMLGTEKPQHQQQLSVKPSTVTASNQQDLCSFSCNLQHHQQMDTGNAQNGMHGHPVYRDPKNTPLRKMSVDLIKTYKHINEVTHICLINYTALMPNHSMNPYSLRFITTVKRPEPRRGHGKRQQLWQETCPVVRKKSYSSMMDLMMRIMTTLLPKGRGGWTDIK